MINDNAPIAPAPRIGTQDRGSLATASGCRPAKAWPGHLNSLEDSPLNLAVPAKASKAPGINADLPFYPLSIAVLTISDTRTEATDSSGGLLADRLRTAGHHLAARAIVTDEIDAIQAQVRAWVANPAIDVILTTGGTGFAPRDVTPEAVRPLLARVMDGFSVVFHQASQATVGISTLQSRSLAGQIDETFIFCVPGSTGACRDAWDLVLALEFDSRFKPCSLVGQIPRYRGVCA